LQLTTAAAKWLMKLRLKRSVVRLSASVECSIEGKRACIAVSIDVVLA